jgi:hypothetical protein
MRTGFGLALSLALGGLAMPVLGAADGPDFFRVTGVKSGSAVNIRSGPGRRHAVIGRIPAAGNGIRNLGCAGGPGFDGSKKATDAEREASRFARWCKVTYEGVTGWTAGWHLGEGQAPGTSCRVAARSLARLELLFGTARRQGTPISDEEWASFLDAEITPRFPDGLTVLSGVGQWRDRNGQIVKEQSILLVIWHKPTDRTDADIEAIRAAYKQRFDQESVMRVEGVSCVWF